MIIYKVTNNINGKVYIGQSVQPLKKRRQSHEKAAYSNTKEWTYFLWALREHGKENFIWEVIEECSNHEELNDREVYYIKRYKSDNPDIGYNSTPGGSGTQSGKNQSISTVLAEGQAVNRKWLNAHGFARPSIDYYLRSNIIVPLCRGIYRKPGPQLKIEHIVYSLLELGYTVHIGHTYALQFHGYAHFLRLGGTGTATLYVEEKTPKWPFELELHTKLERLSRNPYPEMYNGGIEKVPFGSWDWEIPYSTPERAFIEMCSTLDTEVDIVSADKTFEGAGSLRPKLLQILLENTRQVKAKRLFLWYARRHAFPWFSQINIDKIELGSGKRQIVTNGVYDSEFRITVPRGLEDGQNEPIF